MRFGDERESDNIEDRRGGGFGFSPGVAGGGIGAVAIIVIGLLLGVDPGTLLQLVSGNTEIQTPAAANRPAPQQRAAADDPLKRFVGQVLAETEDTWRDIFRQMGRTYEDPHLVLYSGATQSACGFAEAAVGPFYCSGDRRVYLDLAFFQDMQRKLGAPGDFARAYVIAHEVGHHVQTLLGITARIDAGRRNADRATANALSVRLELQADCLAGLWANQADRTRHILEPGDIEQRLAAASAVGDDRLQQRARGTVVPESFTHGSSAQRVRWFKRGYTSGKLQQCDTFNAPQL
jgi:predicted metalloprotease